jgi:hypothetical protein
MIVCTGAKWLTGVDRQVPSCPVVNVLLLIQGVVPNIRYEVWKFLLGYFPWDATHADRQKLRKQKVEEYFQMKLQWRSITPGQEQRFSDYHERKSLVGE